MSKADHRLNLVHIYSERSTRYGFKAFIKTAHRSLYAAELNGPRLVEKPIIYLKNRKVLVKFENFISGGQ